MRLIKYLKEALKPSQFRMFKDDILSKKYKTFFNEVTKQSIMAFLKSLLSSLHSSYRPIVLSFYRSIVLSFYRSIVLSFYRSIVPSFYRSFVPSSLPLLFIPHLPIFSFLFSAPLCVSASLRVILPLHDQTHNNYNSKSQHKRNKPGGECLVKKFNLRPYNSYHRAGDHPCQHPFPVRFFPL